MLTWIDNIASPTAQWRIQDFPEGTPTPKVGVTTYYFA